MDITSTTNPNSGLNEDIRSKLETLLLQVKRGNPDEELINEIIELDEHCADIWYLLFWMRCRDLMSDDLQMYLDNGDAGVSYGVYTKDDIDYNRYYIKYVKDMKREMETFAPEKEKNVQDCIDMLDRFGPGCSDMWYGRAFLARYHGDMDEYKRLVKEAERLGAPLKVSVADIDEDMLYWVTFTTSFGRSPYDRYVITGAGYEWVLEKGDSDEVRLSVPVALGEYFFSVRAYKKDKAFDFGKPLYMAVDHKMTLKLSLSGLRKVPILKEISADQ